MPSRSGRRNEHKRARRPGDDGLIGSHAAARWYLARWRAEAKRRADRLDEPAVWALAGEAEATVRALDPDGRLDLAGDLHQLCIDAVAAVAGWNLAGGSRPAADRARVSHLPQDGRTTPQGR